MSKQINELRKIIQDNIDRFVFYEDTKDNIIRLPDFDLYPRDYLEYAESGITNGDAKKLIECVSHLKRAMDCQIDVFFSVFGLKKYFEKRRLGVDKKLDFLRNSCIFDSSRTLSRLNTIRNKMEHNYEIPEIKDVEIYFDLVLAFVSTVESSIVLLSRNDMVFANVQDSNGKSVNLGDGDEYISVVYDFDKPEISIGYDNVPERNIKIESGMKNGYGFDPRKDPTAIFSGWDATPSTNYEEFVYYFRVFNLLAQREAFVNDKYIISRL